MFFVVYSNHYLFGYSGPPRFLERPSGQQAVNGSEVTLVCYAVAELLHRVTWYFTNASNITVEIGSTNSSIIDGHLINSAVITGSNGEMIPAVPAEYGSLTITNIQYSNRGVYECRPENRYDVLSASASVAVQGMYVQS